MIKVWSKCKNFGYTFFVVGNIPKIQGLERNIKEHIPKNGQEHKRQQLIAKTQQKVDRNKELKAQKEELQQVKDASNKRDVERN